LSIVVYRGQHEEGTWKGKGKGDVGERKTQAWRYSYSNGLWPGEFNTEVTNQKEAEGTGRRDPSTG